MYVSFKNNWLVWFEIYSFSAPILPPPLHISQCSCVAEKMLLGMDENERNCEEEGKSDGEYFIWPGIGSRMMSKGSRDPAFRMMK